MTWVGVEIVQGVLLFFLKYVVERETTSEPIMATIFVTAILALPIWEWVSRRYDKRRAYIIGIAFWAVVQMVLITLTPSTPLALLFFLCFLAGIGVAAAHVLPWAIIPDAIEWGEYQTGKRYESTLYSLVTLSRKAATSIALPLILWLLEITGYVANAAQQPPGALWGLRIAMGPIPALMLCLGIFFASKYPLSRGEFSDLNAELEARRAES
jgi:GPH family glycoside/pentoside/hexuronide:cation symporter